MNYPNVGVSTLQQLRYYKAKNGYTDAQVATLLAVFGWKWQEDHIADLMDGRVKPTEVEEEFFKRFLLYKFWEYNCS